MRQFRRRFSQKQMHVLVADYQDPKEPGAMAAGQRLANGELTKANLVPIIKWKAERSLHHLDANDETDIEDALRCMASCRTERARVAVLRGLRGVNIPMASAILTAFSPKAFT